MPDIGVPETVAPPMQAGYTAANMGGALVDMSEHANGAAHTMTTNVYDGSNNEQYTATMLHAQSNMVAQNMYSSKTVSYDENGRFTGQIFPTRNAGTQSSNGQDDTVLNRWWLLH